MVFQNFLNFRSQLLLLSADFGAEGEQWTTQHTATLLLHFSLFAIGKLAIVTNSVQRWNSRRKQRIHFCTFILKLSLQGDHREVCLRVEEMVKTALLDSCLLANLVY